MDGKVGITNSQSRAEPPGMEESLKRTFSDELAMKEVEKMELISKCKDLEKEVEKYKRMAALFEEQMTTMWEEYGAMRAREQMAQVVQKEKQDDVRETENKNALDEINEWKRRCGDLEIRISELIEENLRLKARNFGDVIEISDEEGDEVETDFKDEVLNADGCRQEERFLSVPTPKKKCCSRVITSDSEDDDDDVDDDTPIGKLKRRKKAEEDDEDEIPIGMLKNSNVGGDAVGEDLTPNRKRLFPLGELERMNCRKEGSYPRDSIDSDRITRRKVMFLNAGDAEGEEDETHELHACDSDSGSESLRGFIVNDSEVDESECSHGDDISSHDLSDECPSDLELDEVLARIRRGKNMKQWEYEADMLASFSKDPELCMKAVCAVYRQQTAEEKSVKGTLLINNRGFSKFDALKGSRMAEFLLDGDPNGPLKKSVEELQKYDRHGLDYCSKLARHYSKQLFMIYQNKEDPFFLPS
ncbi:uncharacterized protein LOC120281416 isoform X2 [Dioscorea cayenensis subsp. rotundata]|uniref:Uncharacterized protein LOC120281416 isoform X2 n=1 Tax=Dioscorea cayennensis subsp. rotundata TaxID=55577 RepID=A0AB40D1S4_DIOCR|nr:uncharacterized protein LOC120281416 isoform X2 [Dioscorea cayenensis subsp. rotundata]